MAALTLEQKTRLEQVLKQRYRHLIREVQAELGADGEKYIADFNESGGTDWGDASVADALADIAAARADRQVNEMREIEAARKRIKAGDYGTCADCGENIPFDRLLAYPAALRCIKCQELHERTYGADGTPSL